MTLWGHLEAAEQYVHRITDSITSGVLTWWRKVPLRACTLATVSNRQEIAKLFMLAGMAMRLSAVTDGN